MKIKKSIVACLSLLLFTAGCNVPDSRGKILYANNCMNCHGEEGGGLKQLIPPLADSDYLVNNRDRLACIIRYGLNHEIMVNNRSFHHPMPGNTKLSEEDITSIINYISRSWGNDEKVVFPDEVKKQLSKCEPAD